MMRIAIITLVWLTPAVIAGMLGWSGIWGSGPAFIDYLVPFPVAGGIFHLPGFCIAAILIQGVDKWDRHQLRWVPLLAAVVMLAAATLQLDFRDLNDWLFTNYKPYGSPLSFDNNPLYLFIMTDAFWVMSYYLARGVHSPLRSFLVLPLVPLALVALQAGHYQATGAEFRYGYTMPGVIRGQEHIWVYSPVPYEAARFRQWLEHDAPITRPWNTPNAEHTAVYFTQDMQSIRLRDREQRDGIVATICLYEEDRSFRAGPGYVDCFTDRKTVMQKLSALMSDESTGFGRDIDLWYANARLCQGVIIPDDYSPDIELLDLCHGFYRRQPDFMARMSERYGAGSGELEFLYASARALGLNNNGESAY